MKTTQHRIKENYNNSGKQAKRRQVRRNEAIDRQASRLADLRVEQLKFICSGIDAAVEHATKTLNSL